MGRFSFRGAHVVITGGSSGIGLATAEACAARGASVTLLARDSARLEAAREAVEAKRANGAEPVRAIVADVSDAQALDDAAAQLKEAGSPPDVLINNAGVVEVGAFLDLSPERFEHVIDIDLMGVVRTTRAFLPSMLEAPAGRKIVNVSSGAGFLGLYGYTAYSAAKFGVLGLSECLRNELKPEGIGLHVVCPPDADTPLLARERLQRPPETDRIAGTVKAIPANKVADALVRGVERGKYMIIPGFETSFYHKLKGVWPGLFYLIFDSQVASVRRQEGR